MCTQFVNVVSKACLHLAWLRPTFRPRLSASASNPCPGDVTGNYHMMSSDEFYSRQTRAAVCCQRLDSQRGDPAEVIKKKSTLEEKLEKADMLKPLEPDCEVADCPDVCFLHTCADPTKVKEYGGDDPEKGCENKSFGPTRLDSCCGIETVYYGDPLKYKERPIPEQFKPSAADDVGSKWEVSDAGKITDEDVKVSKSQNTSTCDGSFTKYSWGFGFSAYFKTSQGETLEETTKAANLQPQPRVYKPAAFNFGAEKPKEGTASGSGALGLDLFSASSFNAVVQSVYIKTKNGLRSVSVRSKKSGCWKDDKSFIGGSKKGAGCDDLGQPQSKCVCIADTQAAFEDSELDGNVEPKKAELLQVEGLFSPTKLEQQTFLSTTCRADADKNDPGCPVGELDAGEKIAPQCFGDGGFVDTCKMWDWKNFIFGPKGQEGQETPENKTFIEESEFDCVLVDTCTAGCTSLGPAYWLSVRAASGRV